MSALEPAQALRLRGWSCGDWPHIEGHDVVWEVFAHNGRDWVIVRSATQSEAWDAAVRMALSLEF